MKKLLFGIIIAIVLDAGTANAQLGERVMGVDPQVQLKRAEQALIKCAKGFASFLYIGTRVSDIPAPKHIRLRWPPYFRDLLLMPAHFADVLNIEQQLNRARNAVMSAAFRCDTNAQTAAERSYFKLEAELYFVRYFVKPLASWRGWIKVQRQARVPSVLDNPQERTQFLNTLIKDFSAVIPGANEEQKKVLLTAYFEEFEARYGERPNAYGGADDVWGELANKLDQFIDTLKSLKNLGSELKGLAKDTGEAVAEGARAVGDAGKKMQSLAKSPKSIISAAGGVINSVFQVCPRRVAKDCKGIIDTAKDVVEEVMGVISSVKKFSEKKTFDDIKVAIEMNEVQKSEDITKGEMLARYEMLYGQASGGGLVEIMEKMDELLMIVQNGRGTQIQGSTRALVDTQKCVKMVRTRECS